jgi:SulP family sulfate permease
VAGLIHAMTLLLIMLLFADWAEWIPLPALAGILLSVAYNMSEWRMFKRLFRSPPSDVLVLLTTFSLTVLIDLAVALQVGIVLASLLFMRRMATLSEAGYVPGLLDEENSDNDPRAVPGEELPPEVEVFRVQGALFFGAASAFKDALGRVEKPPRILILRMRDVLAVDATGLRALEELWEKARRDGTSVVLSGVRPQPREAMERAGLLAELGPENVHADIQGAVARMHQILGKRSVEVGGTGAAEGRD